MAGLLGHRGLLLSSGPPDLAPFSLLALNTWTISEAGMVGTQPGGSASFYETVASKDIPSGKWYWEFELQALGRTQYSVAFGLTQVRLVTATSVISAIRTFNQSTGGFRLHRTENGNCGFTSSHGYVLNGTATTGSSYRPSVGTRCGIAFDTATRSVWARVGSSSWVAGDPAAGTGATGTVNALEASGGGFHSVWRPALGVYTCQGGTSLFTVVRFACDPTQFSWPPPTGFEPYSGA